MPRVYTRGILKNIMHRPDFIPPLAELPDSYPLVVTRYRWFFLISSIESRVSPSKKNAPCLHTRHSKIYQASTGFYPAPGGTPARLPVSCHQIQMVVFDLPVRMPSLPSKKNAPCLHTRHSKIYQASTYSPVQLPVKYHRLCGA